MNQTRLERERGDKIFIASLCGKKDVIVDAHSASSILIKEKGNDKKDNLEKELIVSAVRLITNDFRRLDYDQSSFLDLNELTIDNKHRLQCASMFILLMKEEITSSQNWLDQTP